MSQSLIIYQCVLIGFSLGLGIVYFHRADKLNQLLVYMAIQALAYLISFIMIPKFKKYLLKADLFGYDINKKNTKAGEVKIPETAGLIPATIYLIFMMIGLSFNRMNNYDLVFEYACTVLSISFIILLGFADDVFDLPWRFKIILPIISSLPILVSYQGSTSVLLPKVFKGIMGFSYINIGFIYYIYMAMLIIFCTNSINIYAGINGIEVGQSLIISIGIFIHNVIEVCTNEDKVIQNHHTFSLIVIIPYIFTALALFHYNKYPSEVFVGDTFCYWSGATFAVCAILGHFSKTLLFFFIPQMINFVYSLPQLFQIIPCPRHRLPRYNQQSGKLECIKSNLTMINLVLWIRGPMSENDLCSFLLKLQVLTTMIGFMIRYKLVQFIYH